jgi:regulator of sigma E protease
MSIISNLAGGLAGLPLFLGSFLAVLTVVVFVHELGHFLVARWCGVKVKAFSLGFGPEIVSFEDRHGTRWRLAWIPLGGYVKFMDDENAASMPSQDAIAQMSEAERAGSFHAKPLWRRAAVVAAGPAANFLLAIAIFSIMLSLWGVTKLEPRIGQVTPDSPAAAAGFQPNDLIVSIDGAAIDDFTELQRVVSLSPGRILSFVVDRNGQYVTLTAQPVMREYNDRIAGRHTRPIVGVAPAKDAKITTDWPGPITALNLGVQKTWEVITSTLTYLRDIPLGRQNVDQLGGPIRIAEVSGQVAKLGPEYLINLIAIISISVGLINLFPIPLLDGGHLLFYTIEAVRGRPLSERSQDFGFKIGFAVVMMLMALAFLNDLPIVKRWLS